MSPCSIHWLFVVVLFNYANTLALGLFLIFFSGYYFSKLSTFVRL